MKKFNKTYLTVIVIIIVLLGIFEYFGIVSILPVPKYQKTNEQINLRDVCEKINNEKTKKLCFDIAKENDFEKGLVLVGKNYGSIEDYPWYDFPFTQQSDKYHNFPGGINMLLMDGKKHNSMKWCKEVYLSYTPLKEDYYFCRAFLENPNFCGKIYYPIGPSKGICYQDAAFIWKDPALCKKAKNKDFCYIRLVLNKLEGLGIEKK